MGKSFRGIANVIAAGPFRPAILRYSVAIVLPFTALGLTLLVADLDRAPFFPLFTAAILLSALFGSTRAGIVSVVVSLLLNMLALPPAFSLAVRGHGAVTRLVAFVVVSTTIAVVIGILADIQHKLEYERERLQVTLASIGDGVIVTDTKGRITFLNAVAERTIGWSVGEALNRSLQEVFHIVSEAAHTPVDNPVYRALEHGTIQGLANHTLLVRRDGTEIPIDDSAAPVRDRQGNVAGVVLVFRDISARKEAEQVLLRQEKLATVGRLASTIAHEINNPLASVMNVMYLLEGSPDLPPELREYVAMAQGELARAAHVAKQSLSFYRPLESNTLVPVEPIIVETLSLYKGKLDSKRITAQSRIDSDALALTTSSNLRQVLANLVSNAIDAMVPGGRLEVRVAVLNKRHAPMTRITIADTGHGINRATRGRVFEAFFTTKTNTGTGLGLWLSKQIVEGDGGTIRVKSTPGIGTVFQIFIPGVARPAPKEVAMK